MYQIRPAVESDLGALERVYTYAREFMARTGNPHQWGKINPPVHQLLADIRAGHLYVVHDGSAIHGAFAFIPGRDPTYGYIEDGSWRSDEPYAAIHRVAADGSGGIFSAVLAFCASRCSHLRIDTHRDNKVMQHLLCKHGFQRRGIIYLANGEPRIAYDRLESYGYSNTNFKPTD